MNRALYRAPLRALGAVALFQLGLRIWLRLRPQPIPYGWSWLLENPWRRVYRDPQRTAGHCGLKPTDIVLELGCGSGMLTGALAARCAKLIASDLHPDYLEQTRARTQGATNVRYLLADAHDLPLETATLDVVVLIATLTEVPRPAEALLECRRVLKPGGRIVISEEMFAPEYVPARVTESWASAAGLTLTGASGTAWMYFRHYVSPGPHVSAGPPVLRGG